MQRTAVTRTEDGRTNDQDAVSCHLRVELCERCNLPDHGELVNEVGKRLRRSPSQ